VKATILGLACFRAGFALLCLMAITNYANAQSYRVEDADGQIIGPLSSNASFETEDCPERRITGSGH